MPRISFAKFKLDSVAPPPRRGDQITQVDYFDAAMPGFGLRVSSNNVRTWFLLTRLHGKVRRFTIGRAPANDDTPGLSLKEARATAATMAGQVALGDDPSELADAAKKAKADAANERRDADSKRRYSNVVTAYIEGHAKPNTRSWKDTKYILEHYTMDAWGDRLIQSIRRQDVTELLDEISAKSGRVTANHVLAIVRGMFNWHQARDETFTTPIVKGMARGEPGVRDRELTDTEVAAVWKAAGPDIFGSIVRLLFLTAQRRTEVASMRWEDIDEGAGGPLWTIPKGAYKTGVTQTVPLLPAALAIIKAQPRVDKCPYVFSTNHKTPFQGFSKKKTALDEVADVSGWVLHDIRRTARTLMGRAGISDGTAERVIGHLQPKIVRVYNRYGYDAEKREALRIYEELLFSITR